MKFMKPTETARCVMFVLDVADIPGTIEEQREAITRRLSQYASFKAWAFALHDQDDEPPHWQGFAHTDKNLDGRTFAHRLEVEGVMKLRGGARAVTNALRYLTHESQPAKTQYSRSAVVAKPGWDWESDLDSAVIRDAGDGNAGRKRMIASVQDGQLTALEAIRLGAGNERAIRTARARYLCGLGSQDLPALRVNFYLQGSAHPVLDRLAEALARTLSPRAMFYQFDGREIDVYDGEDVLLTHSALSAWFDHTLGVTTPIMRDGPLGGPRELFAMLSATPRPHSIPTKYGPTQLIHRHTVIVGEEPLEVFRARLEDMYELAVEGHRDQAQLSLPVFVPVDATSFGVQINTRFALGRGELDQYIEGRRFQLGLVEALTASRHVPEEQRARVVRELEMRQTSAIRSAGSLVADAMRPPAPLTADDLLTQHAHLGQPIVTGEIA